MLQKLHISQCDDDASNALTTLIDWRFLDKFNRLINVNIEQCHRREDTLTSFQIDNRLLDKFDHISLVIFDCMITPKGICDFIEVRDVDEFKNCYR